MLRLRLQFETVCLHPFSKQALIEENTWQRMALFYFVYSFSCSYGHCDKIEKNNIYLITTEEETFAQAVLISVTITDKNSEELIIDESKLLDY